MMYWDTPFVNQMQYGGGMKDPLGCWYACISMLGYLFEQGPRLGIGADRFTREVNGHLSNYPIDFYPKTQSDQDRLAVKKLVQNENLQQMITPAAWINDIQKVVATLKTCGPLIITSQQRGQSGNSFSNCALLVGVKNDREILVHEPAEAPMISYHLLRASYNAIQGCPIFCKKTHTPSIQKKWVEL